MGCVRSLPPHGWYACGEENNKPQTQQYNRWKLTMCTCVWGAGTLVHAYTSFVIRNIVLHLAGTFWDLYQDVCNHREIRLRFSFHIYASLDYGSESCFRSNFSHAIILGHTVFMSSVLITEEEKTKIT